MRPGARSASAGQRETQEWVTAVRRAYDAQVDRVAPLPIHEIDAEDLACVRPPDLAERGVGAFVGPLPPEGPTAPATAAPAAAPTSLEAIGQPTAVYWMPENGHGLTTVVGWRFASGATASVRVGEFFREGRRASGRFRLRAVVRKESGRPTYGLVYDVHDDESGPAVLEGRESVFDLLGASAAVSDVIRFVAVGAGRAGGTPSAPSSGAGIVIEPLGENRFGVALDDAGFATLRGAGVEGLLRDVRTDEARDESGGVRGLRFASVPPGSPLALLEVRSGDVLVSIADRPVRSRADAIEILKGLPKGTSLVRAVVDRNGRLRVYDVDPRDPEARRAAGRLGYRDDSAAMSR